MLIQSLSVQRDVLQLKRKTKVAVFKSILLTFESLLAGPTFARCAFKGALRLTRNVTDIIYTHRARDRGSSSLLL